MFFLVPLLFFLNPLEVFRRGSGSRGHRGRWRATIVSPGEGDRDCRLRGKLQRDNVEFLTFGVDRSLSFRFPLPRRFLPLPLVPEIPLGSLFLGQFPFSGWGRTARSHGGNRGRERREHYPPSVTRRCLTGLDDLCCRSRDLRRGYRSQRSQCCRVGCDGDCVSHSRRSVAENRTKKGLVLCGSLTRRGSGIGSRTRRTTPIHTSHQPTKSPIEGNQGQIGPDDLVVE